MSVLPSSQQNSTPARRIRSSMWQHFHNRIAIVFFLSSFCWIWFSDTILHLLHLSALPEYLVSTFKGTAFVLATTLLIRWLVKRETAKWEASRELLRSVIDGTTDALFIKDREGRYLLCNEAAARTMGHTVSDVLGRVDADLLDNQLATTFQKHERLVQQQGIGTKFEVTRHFDGKLQHFFCTKIPYRDGGSQTLGVIGICRDITEQKTVEDQLRAERDRFARLMEALPLVICSIQLRPDGTLTFPYASPSIERIYGLRPEELAQDGSQVFKLIHREDLDRVRVAMTVSARSLTLFREEYRVQSPIFGEIWIECVSVPQRQEDGSTLWHGSLSDTTERKRIQLALRESEEQFRATFEQAAVGITHVSLDGYFLRVNRRFCEITGYRLDQLIRQRFQDITHPDDLMSDERNMHRLLAGETEFYSLEKRYLRPNQSSVWVNLTVSLRRDSTGSPVHFISAIEDITGRKLAEAQALEARTMLRLVLDTVPHGVFWKDRESRHLGCNIVVARALGYESPDDVVGRDDLELRSISADQAEYFLATDRKVVESGKPQLRIVETITKSDGKTIWLETNKLPLLDASGRIIGIIGTWEDITERRQVEEALRESEQRLRTLGDNLPDGVMYQFVHSEEHPYHITLMSKGIEKMLGFSVEEVYTQPQLLLNQIYPDDLPVLQAARKSATPGAFDNHHRRYHRDGSIRWLHHRASRRLLPDGRIVEEGIVIDITARKHAEQLMHDSEERFRRVFENAVTGIAIADSHGNFQQVNPAYCKLLGYPEAELKQRNFRQLIHPEDLANNHEQILRLLNGEVSYMEIENRYVNKNGHPVWVRKYVSILPDAQGKPIQLLALVTDINERIMAEKATRESEERFRTLVTHHPDPVYIVTGRLITFCNPAFVRLMGATSAEEILGRKPFDFIHPEFHERARERMLHFKNDNLPLPLEIRKFIGVDGRIRTVKLSVTPVFDRDGVKALVVLHDQTEQKRLEMQLHHQEMLLREAAELAHVGGWGFDPNTLESDWTEEVSRIHDLDTNSAPRVEDAINFYDPEDRPKIEAAVKNAIVFGIPYDLELRIISAKGVRKWIRTICRPILDGGTVVRVRGSFQDITDRKLLEEKFEQAQKMEAVGRLAGGIAHDFNNLLTVINGYCDLLLMQFSPDDENRAAITAMRDAGERAAGMTAQLLAFSRKAVIAPRNLDLRTIITNSEKLLQRLIGEDISLTLDLAAEACCIKADPNQLDQVVMNLAVNARDAMPQGGILTIGCHRFEQNRFGQPASLDLPDGQYVELTVRDNGSGMTEEILSRLFEPFFTTKGIGKGTGLGLAVVHGVMQQSGGRIFVTSELGRGSQFRLFFPAAETISEDALPVPRAKVSRGSETILLVEDEDSVRGLCRIALESQGYRVLTSSSGREAIDMLADLNSSLNLLVTDVVMPEMSGQELARTVRERCPQVRILFVSGYSDDTVFRHGIRDGADDFLQKPFTPLGLTRKVREVLDRIR